MKKVKRALQGTALVFICVILCFSVTPLQSRAIAYPATDEVDSAILYNAESASFLLNRGGSDLVHPSAATALMTALVAYDALSSRMQETVTITEAAAKIAAGGRLQKGDRVTLEDLFILMLMNEDDCASYTLALTAAKSEKDFVDAMNEKAKSLSMTDTLYRHAYSDTTDGSKTTAKDTALLAAAFYGEAEIRELRESAYKIVTIDGTSSRIYNRSAFEYSNGHYNFLRKGMHGMAVSISSDMLVAYATFDDLSYVAVVYGAPMIAWNNASENYTVPVGNAYETAIKLFTFAQEGFAFRVILRDYEIVGELPVTLSRQSDTVSIVPERDVTCFLPSDIDLESQIVYKYDWSVRSLRAPVRQSDKVGTLRVYLDDVLLDEVDLVTNHTVSKSLIAELFAYFRYIFLHPVTLLLLAALITFLVLRFLRAARRASAIKAGYNENNPPPPPKTQNKDE